MKLRRIYIAYFAFLGFALGATLPFYAGYDAPTVLAEKMSSLFGEKMPLCASGGTQWVEWKDLQNSGDPAHPYHYKLPLSYVAAYGTKGMLSPPAAMPLHLPKAGNADYAAYSYSPVASCLQSALRSRAPPHSSFS
jgi:hypothetical protein